MIEYLIFALSGALLVVGIILFIAARKKEKQKIEQIVERKKNEINNQIKEEKDVYDALVEVRHTLQKDCQEFEKTRRIEQERAQEAHEATERVLDAERERVNADLQGVKKLAEERMARELDIKEAALAVQYNYKKQQFEEDFNVMLEFYEEEISAAKDRLDEFQIKCQAVNEAIRKAEELEHEIDYHRIILSNNAKEDIHYLISIEPNIHNKDLLHKLIWSEYLQLPFNQMLHNIFGSNIPKNVIYCIENINTHKKYIGKTSAEVSKRWTEHIKSSLNIGGIKHQIIHEALFKHWDEFTFSILEIVKDGKLGEREKYYINFFETDKYGYNQKGGG